MNSCIFNPLKSQSIKNGHILLQTNRKHVLNAVLLPVKVQPRIHFFKPVVISNAVFYK